MDGMTTSETIVAAAAVLAAALICAFQLVQPLGGYGGRYCA
jgi:hypothetical protein